jgi:uncharacterized protein YqjF (DUF2071 family)
MRCRRDDDVVTYDSRLRRLGERAASHVVVKVGAPLGPSPLDDFLTARWGAHVGRGRRTTYVPNRHEPWPLRRAEVLELDDGLVASVGLPNVAERRPDHVAFSDGVYAEFARPRRVGR